MQSVILEYCRQHSPITDPAEFVQLYDNLPGDLHGIIAFIQGQMMHRSAVRHHGVHQIY